MSAPDVSRAVALALSRRRFLGGTATLSAAAVGLLAGSGGLFPRRAWAAATSEQDVRILNTALAAEHEAVAAYQVGAESGLLKSDALELAVQFQGQVGLFRGKPCFRCFVGDAFDSDECDNCSELGVLGALPLTIGGFAALLAIRAIAGMGDDAGRLHLLDADKLAWRAIALPADPGCRACAGDPQSG